MEKTIKIIYYFIGSIVGIITILTFIVNLLGINSIIPNEMLQFLFSIPWYVFLILFLCIVILYYHFKQTRTPSKYVIAAYGGQKQNIATLTYAGVLWDVIAPIPSQYETKREYIERLPNILDVKLPPRCPDCDIELEEKKSMVYGYIWNCIDCGFKKRNRYSYYHESDRVKKIAKRDCIDGLLWKNVNQS
jgi:hypothetical protein